MKITRAGHEASDAVVSLPLQSVHIAASLTEAHADKANRRARLASVCSCCFNNSSSPPPDSPFFLPYSLFSSPATCSSFRTPPPRVLYIITSLWSSAAPHRSNHGNSGTTAGWLLLLPGGVACQPPFAPLPALAAVYSISAESMNQECPIECQSVCITTITEGGCVLYFSPVCFTIATRTDVRALYNIYNLETYQH